MPDGDKHCLLVVDDEPLNRELLRRVLSREYEIEEAEDGPQALDVLERRAGGVAVVLCDQLMPGMSGTELAVLARERWPELPFLLLTGFEDEPEVDQARDSGLVAHVVSKPWRGAALKALIQQTLAR